MSTLFEYEYVGYGVFRSQLVIRQQSAKSYSYFIEVELKLQKTAFSHWSRASLH